MFVGEADNKARAIVSNPDFPRKIAGFYWFRREVRKALGEG
jgi:hypothetical protein